MNPPRIPPPDSGIGGRVAHVLLLVPLNTRHRRVIQIILLLPIPRAPLPTVLSHKYHPHLILVVCESQVDLLWPDTGHEPDLRRRCEQVSRLWQWIVVVVMMGLIDLGLGPPEDPERVVEPQIEEREGY